MKKIWFSRRPGGAIMGSALHTDLGADVLIPVGRAVGLELEAAGLAVAELDPDLGSNARDAGLQEGDIIIKSRRPAGAWRRFPPGSVRPKQGRPGSHHPAGWGRNGISP